MIEKQKRRQSKSSTVAKRKRDDSNTTMLFEGERISFDDPASKPRATDEELNSLYAKGEVRIVTESARYSLAGILAMLQETNRRLQEPSV